MPWTHRSCFYLLSGRLDLSWGEAWCWCEVALSCGTWPQLHLWPKSTDLRINPFTLYRYFLASRNVQHLFFTLPSKPEQDQTLNDPDKCNQLSNTHLSPAEQNQLQPDESFHMDQEDTRQENKGTVLGRCHLAGREAGVHILGPTGCEVLGDVCTPGKGSWRRSQYSWVLCLATPQGKGWWEDRKTRSF